MATPGFFGRNIRWIAPLLILLVAVVVLGAMMSLRKTPPPKSPQSQAPFVEVEAVSPEPVQLRVASQGLVEPRYSTDLVAQVSGELLSVSEAFVRGGFVKKGQLLAQIDPTNYEVALQNAKASLASAEAAFEQELAQSEVARVEWENVNDRPAPDLGLRKPQLAQAEAQVTAARAALKQAQKDLQRTKIAAPYDGLIASRAVSPGSFVNVGNPIGRVLDIGRAEVRLPVTNADLEYLVVDGVGSDVDLRLDAGDQAHTWKATVVRSEGVVDENSRMRYLVAEVSDPYRRGSGEKGSAPKLAFGSFVTAEIIGRQLQDAVRLPRSLIDNGEVAVYRDGELHLVSVDILRHSGGETIVTGGLSEGDRVVLTSLEFPVEGMALKLASEASEPGADSQAGEGEQ